MDELSLFIGGLALLWTAVQEYRIYKICSRCPYLPANRGIEVIIKNRKKAN
jgi:hypothetical protein